jgi:hypothetical protein
VIEDGGTEQIAKFSSMGTVTQPADQIGRRRIGHFIGCEQRQLRLLGDRARATVPGIAPHRSQIAVDEVVLRAERRRTARIAQRGHGACTGFGAIAPAQRNRAAGRRPISVAGIVTGGAGQLARCR